ncbi:hypothetical protein LZC95_06640 [Pendulispora brunnea]|uniref:Uncharacterized protein n=1 Tax=Pendulispora brunnea TaxID=2905690 RepID=A0ABZ2KJI1_9BACT
MNAIVRIRQFATNLIRDERGDMSYADKTVHISSAAKVVIGAVAITGAAAATTAVTNNSSSSSDKTSQQINQATGAQSETTEKVKAPFSSQK